MITYSISGEAGELHVVKLCWGDVIFEINRSAGTEMLRERSTMGGALDEALRYLLLLE